MKRVMYLITGFCWGIYFQNKEILGYAIFVTAFTFILDLLLTALKDEEIE